MSEKKYVLERMVDSTVYPYKITPAVSGQAYEPLSATEADFYRRHPDVEDRTRPDYFDVQPGTAGTATVRDYPSVRVFRHQLPSGSQQWLSAYPVEEVLVHADEHVTDFTPDVVVDEARLSQVNDLLHIAWPRGSNETADAVENVLRGGGSR